MITLATGRYNSMGSVCHDYIHCLPGKDLILRAAAFGTACKPRTCNKHRIIIIWEGPSGVFAK